MNFFSIKISIVFLIMLSLATQYAKSQQLDRSVYSVSGRSLLIGSLEMDYNVGEVIVFTGFSSNTILTQGFEQSDITLTSNNVVRRLNTDIKVYPNPVKDQLTIYISKTVATKDMQVELFDIFGKKIEITPIYSTSFIDQYFTFDLSNCCSGIYVVKVFSSSALLLETFKIVKL